MNNNNVAIGLFKCLSSSSLVAPRIEHKYRPKQKFQKPFSFGQTIDNLLTQRKVVVESPNVVKLPRENVTSNTLVLYTR